MMSPIGKHKPECYSKKSCQGFTLIEIILCVVIIGVVLAIAVPNFTNSFLKIELEQTAQDLMALIRWGQSQAVISHQKLVLDINPDEGSYQMFTLNEDDETEVMHKLGNPKLSKKHVLPKGIVLNSDTRQLHIFPNGTIDEATISLVTPSQRKVLSSTDQAGKMFLIDEVNQ